VKQNVFSKIVSSINSFVGRIAAIFIPIIMLLLTIEVTLRYIFNSPTIWAMETSQLTMCTFTVLGGGYALLHNGHVNVDILIERLSQKKRIIAKLVTWPLFFMFVITFFIKMLTITIDSVQNFEHSGSYFDPPVYPVKILMVTGIFLLLMQGVAQCIDDIIIFSRQQQRTPLSNVSDEGGEEA